MSSYVHSARGTMTRLESGDWPEEMWDVMGGPVQGVRPGTGTKQYPAPHDEENSFYSTLRLVRFSGHTANPANPVRRELCQERPLRRHLLSPDAALVCFAPEDPAQRAWLWLGSECSDYVNLAAEEEGVRLVGGRAGNVDRIEQGWEPSIFRALFVDWLTPCGTSGMSISRSLLAMYWVSFPRVVCGLAHPVRDLRYAARDRHTPHI
jgi:hypothetical protein